MNIRKFLRIAIIVMLSIILVASLGMVAWSATGTYPAGAAALSAMESTDGVTVAQDKWITFTPAEKTDTGLIFYPGGLVEPTAYAPILHQIAEHGVLVIIVPMPLNLAIFKTDAANAVIDAYPTIKTWILAGHSLGGAAACIYAENNPERINGLALWDSYPPASSDLSDNDLRVISIYGTTDGIPNPDNFDDQRYLLPNNTQYVAIEGASHAQFGDYGPQKGDVVPSISMTEQHDRVVEIMLDFIKP